MIIALDAATGKTVWEHSYPSTMKDIDINHSLDWPIFGPHTTPLIVGDRLFATGNNKQLMALDKKTGKTIWSHDLVKDFNAPLHYKAMSQKPGYSCHPLAYKDMVIVTVGGPGQALMAFRQDDGRVVWRGGGFEISPSSPIVITVAKVPMLKATAWTLPTLAGTRLSLRDQENIMALELGPS